MPSRPESEAVWQLLHAVDAAQTIHIARAPECFYEKAPLTRAIVGKHPGEAEVAAIMVGYSLLHQYLTDRLEGRWLRTYQVVSFINTARNVANNHRIGLRPFGSGCNGSAP
jgi:hypothetical protein